MPEAIWAEVRRRATLLQHVPRAEIVARFLELAEEIRQEAIAKDTAIEGDWKAERAATGGSRRRQHR